MGSKPTTYRCECKQFFVENKGKVRKNGKPQLMRIEHRKMFFTDYNASGADSGQYRIVTKKGRFTISVIPTIPQSIWNNPNGKTEMWYKLPSDIEYDDGTIERPYIRTSDAAMNEEEILRWLTRRMGVNLARHALTELLTIQPENMKSAALAA